MAQIAEHMGRKRTANGDRHKPGFLVRIPAAFGEIIDQIIALDPGSDRTEWIRIAVRERLEKLGKWPPHESKRKSS